MGPRAEHDIIWEPRFSMTNVERQELVRALPFARRFARALESSQECGDHLVSHAISRLEKEPYARALTPRHKLYAAIIECFLTTGRNAEFCSPLSPTQRIALLLTSLEEVPPATAAVILKCNEQELLRETTQAIEALQRVAQTSVLIIEDEPVIAMDIQDVVQRCGHIVAGIAHTESDAVRMAEELRPGLILADINLGAGGDGMKAVGRILQIFRAPVIFVTAYPERLLTGNKEEPSFIITKPFEPATLAITTYQAVTGGLKAF